MNKLKFHRKSITPNLAEDNPPKRYVRVTNYSSAAASREEITRKLVNIGSLETHRL